MLLTDDNVRHIHCIGAGGIGVSGLVELLLKRGFSVSGSDVRNSPLLDYLRSLGAKIFIGHKAEQVENADLVVYSSAINNSNPEFERAKKLGIKSVQRGHVLADIMTQYYGVAISGTHGKTTTTALAAHVLVHAGVDPTYFIGGILTQTHSSVRVGASNVFISEVDESDATFLYIKPDIAVVTNIECDHMSTYAGCEKTLNQSFLKFMLAIPHDGFAIVCGDDSNIKKLLPELQCQIKTYGVASELDYQIMSHHQKGLHGFAKVKVLDNFVDLEIPLPGLHNMKNAVAAMAIAHQLGISNANIVAALKTFPGVGRRFQSHGDVAISGKTVSIFEDYGHHPTEIRETYWATKEAFPQRRILLVYQPHRYSRTRDLMDDFIDVLGGIDHLVLLPTYAASEEKIIGATSDVLHERIQAAGKQSYYLDDKSGIYELLGRIAQEGDIIMFQGAGDVGALSRELL